MEGLETTSDSDLLRSVVAEAAKAMNEISCAERDIKKAKSRIGFLIMVSNDLQKRLTEETD